MFRLFKLFFALFPLLGNGQSNITPSIDTVIYYNPNQENYFFDLEGKNQKFIFDSVIYDNNRPITVFIKNNTPNKINIYPRYHSNTYWRHSALQLNIEPNNYFKAELIVGQYDKFKIIGPFIGSLRIEYWDSLHPERKNFQLALTGKVGLGNLPPFSVDTLSQNSINNVIGTGEIVEEGKNHTLTINENLKLKIVSFDSTSIYSGLTLTYGINTEKSQTLIYKGEEKWACSFNIPSKVNDTIHFTLTNSKYGFIIKESFIRGQFNEKEIIVKNLVSLTTPHYYGINRQRETIPKNWLSTFYIPRGFEVTNKIADEYGLNLDSIQKIFSPYGCKIEYIWDGYLLTCTDANLQAIKSKLNITIYSVIGERAWLTDDVYVYISAETKDERIDEIMNELGVNKYWISEDRRDETKYPYCRVSFSLKNLNSKNPMILNKLLLYNETLWIRQLIYVVPKND